MRVKDSINQQLSDFQKLGLEEKLTKLFEESLLERYSLQLEKEGIGEIEYSDEYLDQRINDDLEYRISELILTAKEILFITKALGFWDILVRQNGSHRSAALILNLLTKQNAQLLQNVLSRSETRGVNNKDFTLNQSEEIEFFAKLDNLPKATLPQNIIHNLRDWNKKNSGL